MPPKRKSKAAEASTPKASSTPIRHDDAMDIDTPQASETPRPVGTPTATKPSLPPASEILDNPWTEDQISSLFKAIIRWKPSGVHKHFRMIAISEHLRNHGFDPDVETHTRMPGIWKQLRLFYNMDLIDEGDNSFDYPGESLEDKYKPFDLPANEFHDRMWARAMAEPGEESDSAPATHDGGEDGAASGSGRKMRKRKRGGDGGDGASVAGSTTAKTRRSSTVDDTDQDTTAPSSPASKSARNTRSLKRAAAKASAAHSRERRARTDSDHDDDEEAEDDEEENEGEDDDEEEEEDSDNDNEETEAPTTRSGRGVAAARGRGRARSRAKGSRKKG